MLRVDQVPESVDVRDLKRIRNRWFTLRVLVWAAVCALFIWIIASGPVWGAVLAIVGLGLMYAHGVELQHQCLHNTAFSNNKLNRAVGVVLGLPLLVSYSDYRLQHLRHHKLLGTEQDREFFAYGYDRLDSWRVLIPHFFMVRHYVATFGFIWKSLLGKLERDARPKAVRKIMNEYRLMAVMLVAFIVLSVVFETWLFVGVFLLPLLVGIPTHALIELPEHIGCERSTTDVRHNTRTIRAGRFATWFVNGNNYHVEHHWLPDVPNERLPQLHDMVQDDIEYFDQSYWAFYRDFFKRFIGRGTKTQSPALT